MSDVEDQDNATGRMQALKQYCTDELTESWGDAILILCCFVTGLLDSAVFNVWSCFVSMQTGNTVYVGLGVSGQPKDQPMRWAKSGTAILCFVIGAFVFSRGMRYLGPLRRTTVVLTFLIQALLIYISAALVQSGVVPKNAGTILPENFIVLLPLSLLSIQSAGQIIMSRILGYGELTTVVLTSAYCDLAFDEKVLVAPPKENSKRNRRLASIVMVVAGAIAGGFLTTEGDISYALWIAGSIKVIIAAIWAFWKSTGSVHLE